MSLEHWDRQKAYLDAIEIVTNRMKDDMRSLEHLLRGLEKTGTSGLPNPTRAAETLRLTAALCLSGIETIERPAPVILRFPQAAE